MSPLKKKKMLSTRISLILLLVLALDSQVSAQITTSGLTEFQVGRVPGADETSVSTFYQQVNADYTHKTLQIGLRAEVFTTWRTDIPGSPLDQVEYRTLEIPQKYLRWSAGRAEVVVGNYYTSLGRGLTLRAFELPGVVLESQTFRRRYAPSRDLEGGTISWSGDRIEARALVGRPVIGDVPPGVKSGNPPTLIRRRNSWLAGGELAIRPSANAKLGGTVVTLTPDTPDSTYTWSAYGELDLTRFAQKAGLGGIYSAVYAEYARLEDASTQGDGLYLSGNIGGDRLGLSLEYKDYDNLSLVVNDPPSLVREHSAVILNRNTHVLLPLSEKGHQVEATYTLPSLGTITANSSKGVNQLAPGFSTTFQEQYLGLELERFIPVFSASAFLDWGKDELEGLLNHRSGGIGLEKTSDKGFTTGLDLQMKRGTRTLDASGFTDIYGQLSWRHPKGFGAGVLMDHTSDPLETDDPATLGQIESDSKTWWAINLSFSFSGKYDALVFAGRRRGGTACTSGTCYQVLPFKGVEVRLRTNF